MKKVTYKVATTSAAMKKVPNVDWSFSGTLSVNRRYPQANRPISPNPRKKHITQMTPTWSVKFAPTYRGN